MQAYSCPGVQELKSKTFLASSLSSMSALLTHSLVATTSWARCFFWMLPCRQGPQGFDFGPRWDSRISGRGPGQLATYPVPGIWSLLGPSGGAWRPRLGFRISGRGHGQLATYPVPGIWPLLGPSGAPVRFHYKWPGRRAAGHLSWTWYLVSPAPVGRQLGRTAGPVGSPGP